ncbi:hypothetical protein TYRP_022388 [Tyrophagus putrescentiae]|nr:hypothetical protein TYRP_022388 [Tyrophagus putrescentiae]
MTPTVHRHLLLLLHLHLHHHHHHPPLPLLLLLPPPPCPCPPDHCCPIATVFPFPANTYQCPPDFAQGILCGLNVERAIRGYGVLRLDATISAAAGAWASTRRTGNSDLKPGETNYGQAYWKASLPPPCYGRSLPVRPADIIGSLYENCKNFRPLLAGPATGANDFYAYSDEQWRNTQRVGVGCNTYHDYTGALQLFVTVWFDVPSNQINIQADADDELKKKVEADESLANEEAPEMDVPSLGADENDNAEDLHQTKADSFNFRVPSLGCPDGFADALVDGINQLRADDEDGNQFRPLKRDKGVLAFEASAWAATNRYLGNRRPRERRFGQNYWFWFGSPNTGNFRRTIDDFLGGGRGKHFRPMIWKRSDQFEDGWSWQPFTRAEWAATTRVGVGCLTDYNSFQGGQAQVFVSLFYDYTKKSG